MRAGIITIAVILAWIASGIVSSLALVAFLELCFGKVKAAGKSRAGSAAKETSGLRVTNQTIQIEQTNSLQSKPRFSTGRGGK